jgi:phage terminase large subunit-like protein
MNALIKERVHRVWAIGRSNVSLVVARFEAGAAFFAGRFPELEDELAGLVLGGGYEGPGRSPDRRTPVSGR